MITKNILIGIALAFSVVSWIIIWRLSWLTRRRYKRLIADQQQTIALLQQALLNKDEQAGNGTRFHVDDLNQRFGREDEVELCPTYFLADDRNKMIWPQDNVEEVEVEEVEPPNFLHTGEHALAPWALGHVKMPEGKPYLEHDVETGKTTINNPDGSKMEWIP